MFEKMMQDWTQFQQKMMPDMQQAFKNAKDVAESFRSIPNPMVDSEKWSRFMENSIKFQKAYIAQQQALLEMMEAMTDNAKILSDK